MALGSGQEASARLEDGGWGNGGGEGLRLWRTLSALNVVLEPDEEVKDGVSGQVSLSSEVLQ